VSLVKSVQMRTDRQTDTHTHTHTHTRLFLRTRTHTHAHLHTQQVGMGVAGVVRGLELVWVGRKVGVTTHRAPRARDSRTSLNRRPSVTARNSQPLEALRVVPCKTLPHTAIHCTALQYTATRCNAPPLEALRVLPWEMLSLARWAVP